jgi:hypothetical protein
MAGDSIDRTLAEAMIDETLADTLPASDPPTRIVFVPRVAHITRSGALGLLLWFHPGIPRS